MTPEETTAIMAVIFEAYPRFYIDKTDEEIDTAAALWAEMFADEPATIVAMAVKAFIATDTKGYPPHIGAIKNQIVNITNPPRKSALEAWAEVKRALKNSYYCYVEEFARLDADTQRIIGSSLQLKEWSQMSTDTLDSVIGSNFRESYNAFSNRQRDRAALPPAVSEMVKQLANSKTIEQSHQAEPKALPISVEATINQLKRVTVPMPTRNMPEPLSPEEFEKRRAEILSQIIAVESVKPA